MEEDKSFADLPDSPSKSITSNEDNEMVMDSQIDSFASRLESLDQDRKQEIASQLGTSQTQAEEEALPPGKPKRKKEKSHDVNRASVQFSKPSKNHRKNS